MLCLDINTPFFEEECCLFGGIRTSGLGILGRRNGDLALALRLTVTFLGLAKFSAFISNVLKELTEGQDDDVFAAAAKL